MQVIPAIDILGGKCVRLKKGDYDTAHVFGDDPLQMARHFIQLGARRLHIVDLDAAKSGRRENTDIIDKIVAQAAADGAQTQVGGGLRTMQAIESVLAAGASFAVVGTAAARDAIFLQQALARFVGRMILGVDARGDKIAISGWREESALSVDELLMSVGEEQLSAVIFTDILKDGMMGGASIEATCRIAQIAPCPVIASGGARGEVDVQALMAAHANIQGVIIGRAAYENFSALESLLKKYG